MIAGLIANGGTWATILVAAGGVALGAALAVWAHRRMGRG